jgi:hypothetical protein
MSRLTVALIPVTATLVVASLALPRASAGRSSAQRSAVVTALLAKSSAYLEAYDRQLAAVVAVENYRLSAPGRSDRSLKSDLMLLDLGNSNRVEFRDVFEMNGSPVRDHAARLQGLFEHPDPDLLRQAQRIANESASYNIGVHRNINVPTMALTYLIASNQARSTFELEGDTKSA